MTAVDAFGVRRRTRARDVRVDARRRDMATRADDGDDRRDPARESKSAMKKRLKRQRRRRRQAREARRGEAAQSRRRGVDQGGVSRRGERDVERGAGRVFRRARREDRGATTRDGGEEGKATGAALVGVRMVIDCDEDLTTTMERERWGSLMKQLRAAYERNCKTDGAV